MHTGWATVCTDWVQPPWGCQGSSQRTMRVFTSSLHPPHPAEGKGLTTGVLCGLCPFVLQKDLLEGCDIDVALVGHALSQDQEHAELFEIEW